MVQRLQYLYLAYGSYGKPLLLVIHPDLLQRDYLTAIVTSSHVHLLYPCANKGKRRERKEGRYTREREGVEEGKNKSEGFFFGTRIKGHHVHTRHST